MSRRNPIASLCSKIKTWCAAKHIPVVLIPIVLFALAATAFVIIYGISAGWNILGALVSETAVLIYALTILLVVILVFRRYSSHE